MPLKSNSWKISYSQAWPVKPVYVFVLETLGLQESDPAEYFYLNRTGGVYDIPDVDDTEEFYATMVNSYTLMC